MEETEDSISPSLNVEAEIKELLGLFDAPAFARRGQDLEYALARLHDRCARQRDAMLDMVRVRLRQWSSAVTGPDGWSSSFDAPIEPALGPRRRRGPRVGRPPRADPPPTDDRPRPGRQPEPVQSPLDRVPRRPRPGALEPDRRPVQPLLPPGEGMLPRLGPAGRPPLRPAGASDPRVPPRCASHVARPRTRRLRGHPATRDSDPGTARATLDVASCEILMPVWPG